MTWAELAGDVLFAAMDVFGTAFIHAPKGEDRPAGPFSQTADGRPLRGVWDEAHALVTLGGEGSVSTTAPVLGVRMADLAVEPLQGDEITIGGRVWEIVDPRPDGQGGAKLILELKPV